MPALSNTQSQTTEHDWTQSNRNNREKDALKTSEPSRIQGTGSIAAGITALTDSPNTTVSANIARSISLLTGASSPTESRRHISPPKDREIPCSSSLNSQFIRTRLCPDGESCPNISTCTFAHRKEELRPSVDLSRTKLCAMHENRGNCSKENCSFAHGHVDLRSTLPYFKTIKCTKFFDEANDSRLNSFEGAGCTAGLCCRHVHFIGESEMWANLVQRGAIKDDVIDHIEYESILEHYAPDILRKYRQMNPNQVNIKSMRRVDNGRGITRDRNMTPMLNYHHSYSSRPSFEGGPAENDWQEAVWSKSSMELNRMDTYNNQREQTRVRKSSIFSNTPEYDLFPSNYHTPRSRRQSIRSNMMSYPYTPSGPRDICGDSFDASYPLEFPETYHDEDRADAYLLQDSIEGAFVRSDTRDAQTYNLSDGSFAPLDAFDKYHSRSHLCPSTPNAHGRRSSNGELPAPISKLQYSKALHSTDRVLPNSRYSIDAQDFCYAGFRPQGETNDAYNLGLKNHQMETR